MRSMKISFKTAQQETTWERLKTIWREADDIDIYTGGWLFDHFYPLWTDSSRSCMEAWSTAAALAAVTDRVRIGHMVTSNTYRHPAVAANTLATLDQISGGRLDFGFGAGWFEEEHDAYGIDLPPLKERFDRFDEAIEVIDLLLTQHQSTFTGRYYRLRDAYCEPKPLQTPRPPLVIGGRGEKRLLKAAARWADHYNYPLDDMEGFSRCVDVLGEWCENLGRDPTTIEISLQIWGKDPGESVEKAQRAIAAGADHVIYYIPPPHDVSLLVSLAERSRELRTRTGQPD